MKVPEMVIRVPPRTSAYRRIPPRTVAYRTLILLMDVNLPASATKWATPCISSARECELLATAGRQQAIFSSLANEVGLRDRRDRARHDGCRPTNSICGIEQSK